MRWFSRGRGSIEGSPQLQPQVSDDEKSIRQELGLPEDGELLETQQLQVQRGLDLGEQLREKKRANVTQPKSGDVFVRSIPPTEVVQLEDVVYDLDKRKFDTQSGLPQPVQDADVAGGMKRRGKIPRVSVGQTQAEKRSAVGREKKEMPRREGEMREGDILKTQREGQDDYILTKKLGEGGMGFVFLGENLRNGLTHAIKFVRQDVEGGDILLKRFERERIMLARASRHKENQMDSLFNMKLAGRIDTVVDGQEMTGIITEYIEGNNLQDEINHEDESMKIVHAIEYAAEIALALVETEQAGIVHRDLKPENVFLQDMHDGTKMVKLGDFGIAKFFGDEAKKNPHMNISGEFRQGREKDTEVDLNVTQEGFVVGTAAVMAPEQVEGKELDGRTDLYALGHMMYEMFAGERALSHHKKTLDLMVAQVREKPASFKKQGVHDVPVWLEEITMKLLEKDPDDRFQSAMEVYSALKKGAVAEDIANLELLPFRYNFDGKGQVYYATLAAEARADLGQFKRKAA